MFLFVVAMTSQFCTNRGLKFYIFYNMLLILDIPSCLVQGTLEVLAIQKPMIGTKGQLSS